MKDEEFVFRADSRDKAITARSAKSKKTKGGRVRLPSDNLSKKELQKMNGECKSYRLNDPMTRKEFQSMPDDLKAVYIKAIRNKYGVPDLYLGKALGFSQQGFAHIIKRLGLGMGKTSGKGKWDKDGFYAWWHGVDKLPVPVAEEEPSAVEEPATDSGFEIPDLQEAEWVTADDLTFVEPDPAHEENITALLAEIDGLKYRVDELLMHNEELMAVHEKDRAEIEWLRNECESQSMNARILEAQMDVVRLIFGGKNHG